MRVLTVIPRYWPAMGGAEQHTRELLRHLSKKNKCKVATVCGSENYPTDVAFAFTESKRVRDDNVIIERVSARGIDRRVLQFVGRKAETNRMARRLFRSAVKRPFQRVLRRLSKDVDVVHAVYNGFTPAAEVAANLGKPFVWTPLAHTTLPRGTGWSSRGFQKLYKRADALIAMTEYEKEWLIEMGARRDNTHVVPMAPLLATVESDAVAFRRAHNITEKNVVLFLGRATKSKGAQLLCDAADAIWKRNPDTAIVIAGPIDSETHRKANSIQDPRLKVCGMLDEENKQAAFKACDMVCVPSAEESLGVVYLEAWSFGKPVVAANLPVLQTVISHNVDGILVDRTPANVAWAVNSLLLDPARSKQLGKNGFEKVGRQYCWSNSANHLSNIYRDVVKP